MQEPGAYRGYIRGLQGASMQAISNYSLKTSKACFILKCNLKYGTSLSELLTEDLMDVYVSLEAGKRTQAAGMASDFFKRTAPGYHRN